ENVLKNRLELVLRIRELEAANHRLLQRASVAERAAQRAEESARRAWKLFAASGTKSCQIVSSAAESPNLGCIFAQAEAPKQRQLPTACADHTCISPRHGTRDGADEETAMRTIGFAVVVVWLCVTAIGCSGSSTRPSVVLSQMYSGTLAPGTDTAGLPLGLS